MDLRRFFRSELEEHAEVLKATIAQCEEPFLRLVGASLDAIRRGGKLLFFGNGGSAADAQHLAAEFLSRYLIDRRPLPALALTTDPAVLTAITR